MASSSPPWPPSMDADATDFAFRLETEKYFGAVDDLGWVRWSSDYRMLRGNGQNHIDACVLVFETIDAIRAGQSPKPYPPGAYDLPWKPELDQDAPKFAERLRAIYYGNQHRNVDGLGWVRWSSDYRVARANGMSHDAACNKVEFLVLTEWGMAPPVTGAVRPIDGRVRVIGRSFGDNSGPRIIHGCSYFPALAIAHQDPDEFKRQLDRTMPHQQYQRWLWRLNGWHWSGSPGYPSANLTVDPLRDPWFEETLRWALEEAWQRGLRINLSSGDMNNMSHAEQEHWFKRVAQIAATVSTDVVWLNAVTNEMRGTWEPGETDENIHQMSRLLSIMQAHYPWSLLAGSDPGSQDKEGMKRLSPSPANVALIHDVRYGGESWDSSHAIRRCFNGPYENFPGEPIVQDEPTGPNGTFHGDFSQKVWQPFEKPDDLFAIYTMHIITGQASTYFNDPALLSRQPLDSTWGFKELPALWRAMEIPQNIGQGTLKPGHHSDAPLQVQGSNADRADCTVAPGNRVAFGIVSGGGHWNVKSGWDAEATLYNAEGPVSTKRVRAGEPVVTSGGDRTMPVVVRLTR